MEAINAGLRIDVDTMRGTRVGVPNLVSTLADYGVRGTFFFSVGPDNMGRHLWRLFRPSFLLKMLRSKAVSLYGLDILVRGTFWPGSLIGQKAAEQIRMAATDHEIGLHAWDHHKEQTRIEKMDILEIRHVLAKGLVTLQALIGRPVRCTAAPAWKGSGNVLRVKDSFDLLYNSDCRGYSIFRPQLSEKLVSQPQVPTTLPTYDEIVGKNGVTAENYNDYLLGLFRPGELNVLTIHAEVEGIVCKEMFGEFLEKAQNRGIRFRPLGELLEQGDHCSGEMSRTVLPGREGWVACQREMMEKTDV